MRPHEHNAFRRSVLDKLSYVRNTINLHTYSDTCTRVCTTVKDLLPRYGPNIFNPTAIEELNHDPRHLLHKVPRIVYVLVPDAEPWSMVSKENLQAFSAFLGPTYTMPPPPDFSAFENALGETDLLQGPPISDILRTLPNFRVFFNRSLPPTKGPLLPPDLLPRLTQLQALAVSYLSLRDST